MKQRAALLVALIATAAVSVGAGPPRVSREVFPNGVRLLVREDPTAGVVAVSLQTAAGSRLEAPETAGLTHFLHRVMLKGTAKRDAAQLAEAGDGIGGNLDAVVEVDYAEVRGAALARHGDALLGLVAEVALTPSLPTAEIDKERRLILNQLQTRADNPFQFSFDTLLRELYGPHPYAQSRLGRRETVTRFGRDDLLAHHRAIYRPDRMVLAVSGRVDRERVRRTAQRLFGNLTAPAPAPADARATPVVRGDRTVVVKRAQQAQILIGYLGPPLAATDYAAVKVLRAVLGGMSGRLFTELRDRQGLAYSVGALNPHRVGPGFVVAYLGTARENIAAAEAGMRRELERVGTEGVNADELARAKAFLLGDLAMDRRTNARHAWYLAFFELAGVGWEFPERYTRAIESVSAADVQAAAQRYLIHPTTVVLEPPT